MAFFIQNWKAFLASSVWGMLDYQSPFPSSIAQNTAEPMSERLRDGAVPCWDIGAANGDGRTGGGDEIELAGCLWEFFFHISYFSIFDPLKKIEIESLRLIKTSNIFKSNYQLISTMPTKPCRKALGDHIECHLYDTLGLQSSTRSACGWWCLMKHFAWPVYFTSRPLAWLQNSTVRKEKNGLKIGIYLESREGKWEK